MNYNDALTGIDQDEQMARAEDHRAKFYDSVKPFDPLYALYRMLPFDKIIILLVIISDL